MTTFKRPKGILKPPSSFPLHSDASSPAPTTSFESHQLPPFVPPPTTAVQRYTQAQVTTAPLGFGAPKTVAPEQEARHRELAIRHATVLQHRKDAEMLVLENLEELMDFPTVESRTASAARPAPADLARFQKLIVPFNTADYDELLTERNCADRCAYVFCPERLTRDRSVRANVNRLRYDGQRVYSVKQSTLDRWCCSACARRALYIRVQLSETPAWERAAGQRHSIELLHEGDDTLLKDRMRQLQIRDPSGGDASTRDGDDDDEGLMQTAMEQLALERGDMRAGSSRRTALVREAVVERPVSSRVAAPSLTTGSSGAGAVEGHMPRMTSGALHSRDHDAENDSDDDNENDTDWIM